MLAGGCGGEYAVHLEAESKHVANNNNNRASSESAGFIQFKPAGLALFSISLIVVTGLLTALLMENYARPALPKQPAAVTTPASSSADATPPGEMPPWGELLTHDIDLEQPEEYVAFELSQKQPPRWVFAGLNRDQTRAQLLAAGLSEELTDHALSDSTTTFSNSATVISPNDKLLLGMTTASRSKLYAFLAKVPGNHYMQYPFCYPQKTFEQWFGNGAKDDRLTAIVRKLLYPRGDAVCFSDYEFLMQEAKSDEERLQIVKALSRQSAVLARLRVRPDTDIEKILGYWGHGIQVKDVRPLLESTARVQGGATISLLYLLPKFARERLYTFPMPSKPGDPAMDCHWSTMNFFNDPPDDRFTNTTYTVSYIQNNLYQVALPNLYGDVVLILDDKGNAIHSAVYIADDIVFTKNGNNFTQPWMLMRLKDLLARYTTDKPPQMLVYRNKSQ